MFSLTLTHYCSFSREMVAKYFFCWRLIYVDVCKLLWVVYTHEFTLLPTPVCVLEALNNRSKYGSGGEAGCRNVRI